MLNSKSGNIQTRHMQWKTHIELSIKRSERRATMEVFLIYPKSEQAQKELAHELAKFHAEQALKNILKLPCSTEQKLELVDAVVKHLKEQA